MKVLLFAGAGTSVELGVPGMAGLATEFLDHSRRWAIEPDLVKQIMGNDLDIEHLIEELDRICGASPSLKEIGHDTVGLERAEKVRAEVEWFVQHAAERVVARDAQLMWGSILQATESAEITFVTTNYDRAIELAANGEEICLDDGFEPFAEGETARWVGFQRNRLDPMLVKLHGSTDWYADGQTGHPTKLRHPMPLFGRSVLRLSEERELGSALVLPSREKLLTKAPYPRLSQTFLNVADCCDLALFVGSSLRDEHIREAARSIVTRAPVFIVAPKDESHAVEGVDVISQCASTFLVSTLPNALLTANPSAVLRQASGPSAATAQGILSTVRDLLDTSVEGSQRCRAIDELDEMETTLAPFLLRKLLTDDDPTVARYALGLILSSASRDTLIEEAKRSRPASDDAFHQELELLRKLVSSNQRNGVVYGDQFTPVSNPQQDGPVHR